LLEQNEHNYSNFIWWTQLQTVYLIEMIVRFPERFSVHVTGSLVIFRITFFWRLWTFYPFTHLKTFYLHFKNIRVEICSHSILIPNRKEMNQHVNFDIFILNKWFMRTHAARSEFWVTTLTVIARCVWKFSLHHEFFEIVWSHHELVIKLTSRIVHVHKTRSSNLTLLPIQKILKFQIADSEGCVS
jgi:hypothetical protein